MLQIKIFTPAEIDEFHQLVPQELMPNEYGGKAGTLEELTSKQISPYKRQD